MCHVILPAYCIFDCIVLAADLVLVYTIKDGSDPLLSAAFRGHLDVVKFLVIEAKANPHKKNKV